MSKVLCIRDLCFNYDYAITLRKNHVSEKLEKIGINSFKQLMTDYSSRVSTVLLVGALFDEEILLIDQVDSLIEVIKSYSDIEFVVAPSGEIADDSWYNIIHWPDNCHVVSNKVNYYENSKENIVLYSGEINDTLQDSDCYKLPVDGDWNHSISRFLPGDFSQVIKETILIYDTETESGETLSHRNLVLKSFEVLINPDMSIASIGEAVISQKDSSDMVFYKCILTGYVSHEMDKDLINLIREEVNEQIECIYENKTYKNYDIDAIKKENKDNLIGIFIENVQNSDIKDDEEKRVIETGLDYLL